MKNITLANLTLSNFKGIKDLSIDFNHDATDIHGDNATGKTTIFDAFTWLLFGRDSANSADFGIKTFDKKGNVIHGLEHSVKAVLNVDDKPITLERIYKELWTKQRGRTEVEFTGHTTDFLINSVPVKKSEYEDRIRSIIPEGQFKLLTNPSYFNKVLDKRERREIILNLENVSDQVVLDSMTPRPEELIEQLDSYSIDEVRAMAKASMQKTNDEIKDLPVRIDELHGQIKQYDFKALELQKKELQDELNLLSGQIENVQQIISAANAKARSIADKKYQMDEIERRIDREYQFSLAKLEQARKEREDEKREKQAKQNRLVNRLEELEIDHKAFLKAMDKVAARWREVKAMKPPTKEHCNTCGQSLPAELIEESIKNFNLMKSEQLETINQEGLVLKEKIIQISKEIENIKEEIASFSDKSFKEENFDLPTKPELPIEWHILQEEVAAEELALKKDTVVPSTSDMSVAKTKIMEQLSEIDAQLGQKKRNAEIKERIKMLEKKEKELAKIYEEQEKLMKQTENFIRAKVDLISSKVNSHFKNVEFKLFEVQINGGIKETCEALIEGVPYSDANKAAKINAGLDIINTLSQFYQTTAPIFIDNAESFNSLIHTDAQIIRLVVSKDKKLKIQ